MATLTYLEAIREALHEELARDQCTMVMGEDVGLHGGVFRATDGLQKRFGAERVIDTPLAEASIVAVAIGAAANGMRPIAEIQFADYIHPAMNQIMNEAATFCYRSNGAWNLPMVIRATWGAGVHGGPWHSQSLEGYFFHKPGLKIVAPSTAYDAKGLLKSAIRDDNPVLFFEHKKLYRRERSEIPEEEYLIPLGKAEVKRPGDTITVVCWGAMVHQALEAAKTLQTEGTSLEIVDLRSIAPLDLDTVAESVKKTSKAIVFSEDVRTGGVASEIAAFLAGELFEYLDGPVVRVTAPDIPAVPFNAVLEAEYLPTAGHLVEAARKLAAF